MKSKEFSSILGLFEVFPDEQSCIDFYEKIRWGGNVVSPFDPTSKVYKCKNNRYKCKNTGKVFNVRTGTLFDNTKVPLRKWFIAMYMEANHKRGISSCQLARDIGVCQKTAWHMLRRIRECFKEDENFMLSNEVEIDETFVGGKNKNRHRDKKVEKSTGRCHKDKTPVFGMLQRDGKVIAKVVSDTKAKTLLPIIYKHIEKGSTIYSDEWMAYAKLYLNYHHEIVDHGHGIYAVGNNTTNRMEGMWSHLKRAIIGTHYHVSRKYLQLYVDAECFRYNERNISQFSRFNLLLSKSG